MTYLQLLQQFPPRPIRTPEDAIATQEVMDRLIDKPEPLTQDESDYLNVLGASMYEYETVYKNVAAGLFDGDACKFKLEADTVASHKIIRICKDGNYVASVSQSVDSLHSEFTIADIEEAGIIISRESLRMIVYEMAIALEVDVDFDRIWNELAGT